jgi:uncharacterized protein YbaA (DUF1428 family)
VVEARAEEVPMARYVDGFVVPVPKKKLAAYKKLATIASKVWKDHGALEYVEAVGDGLKPGKVTSFPRSVKLKKDEVVVFAFIVYPSKKVRDACMKKVMEDERLAAYMDMDSVPFDGMRMFWGGFKPIVDA